MLYNITILEPSIFFYYDHVTVRVSCDSDIMLDLTPRSSSIENKENKNKNKIKVERN